MVQSVHNPTITSIGNSREQLKPVPLRPEKTDGKGDQVAFSAKAVSTTETQSIVLNRAFEKLRSVVSEAREALGIPEGVEVDTSPEATANRIADFALNFFPQYAKNNGLADDEAGRAQFAEFIGKAINQGVDEARGILTALSALNDDNASTIDQIGALIQERLDNFIANGLGT